jgi:hypothetical protein
MRKLITILIAGLLCLPVLARAADEEGYYARSYARLNYVDGDVFVQRAGDLGYEAGSINLVLAEGDKLGTRDGRAEVQFGGGNYLRLDRSTQVDFANLPRAEGDPYKLHLLSGRIYLRVESMSGEKEFEVHTPDASFYVLDQGLYRFDVSGEQETVLQVISGSCEAAGEGGSVVVNAREQLVASNGLLRSEPQYFASDLDDFGRWNESRDGLLARSVERSYLPSELGEYESEFDAYGTWSYEPTYGYVWVPRISYSDWRPYYYGHWVWYPIIGWTWISDEPWGWCAYHYGRWHWGLGLGWYWIPTRSWGPAWVHWWWNYDYCGWCPLSYYNRPVVVINNTFYGQYGYSHYPLQSRALTVIRRSQLQSPHVSQFALDRTHMSRLGQISLTARQPSIAPSIDRTGRLARQAQAAFSSSRARQVGRVFGSGAAISGPSGRLGTSTRSGERSAISRSGAAGSSSGLPGRAGTISRSSESRAIRTFPSRGSSSSLGSSRTVSQSRTSRTASSSASRVSGFPSRSSTSSSTVRRDAPASRGSAVSSSRGASSSAARSAGSSRTIREYRSNQNSPVSRFRSPQTSSSSSRSSAVRRESGSSSTARSRTSGSSLSRSSVPRQGSGSSSYASPSRGSSPTYRSSSRSVSSPSSALTRSSRSYSIPRSSNRSSSRYSVPSRSSGGSSGSFRAPSRSTRSSSRSYRAPSRSSSGSSNSVRSSSHSSSRSSSSRSSSSHSSGSRRRH